MEGKRKYKVGIRAEQFNKWERRVAMTPKECRNLQRLHSDIQILVEPSNKRIFNDGLFRDAGCLITTDLSSCDLIIGVKQVPVEHLIAGKTYMFFPHVIKAQESNMAMLDAILEKKIRLIDYEKISDSSNKRLVAFGKYAGIAGCIDMLHGLGKQLIYKGYSTPFTNIAMSHNYFNVA
jgi:alpha-aminoadipic semialdehyde synthase